MTIPLYQIDAFASRLFEGNPAAVCPLTDWLPDERMQQIAAENNLSETAFLVHEVGGWRVRWFTPTAEVALCGHATLASAWVVFERLDPGRREVVFQSASGPLTVRRDGELLVMDFPATPAEPAPVPGTLAAALGAAPIAFADGGRDWMAVFRSESEVRGLRPDFRAVAGLDCEGVLATAPGDHYDFVSRCFFPRFGIDEDPVTGSAHCTLAPYWAEQLGRTALRARQISPRGGDVACEVRGNRVILGGTARLYLEGALAAEAAPQPTRA